MDGSLSPQAVICKQCLDQNSSCSGVFPECSRCSRLYLTCEYPSPRQSYSSISQQRPYYFLPPPSTLATTGGIAYSSPAHVQSKPYLPHDRLPSIFQNVASTNSSGYRVDKLPSLFPGTSHDIQTRSRQTTPPARYYSKGLINFTGLGGTPQNSPQNSEFSYGNPTNPCFNSVSNSLIYESRKRTIDFAYNASTHEEFRAESPPRRLKSVHEPYHTFPESQPFMHHPYDNVNASKVSNGGSPPRGFSSLQNTSLPHSERYQSENKQQFPSFHAKSNKYFAVPPEVIAESLTGQEHWVSEFRQLSKCTERTSQPSEIILPLPLDGIGITHVKTFGQVRLVPRNGSERSPRAGFMINRINHEDVRKPSNLGQNCSTTSSSPRSSSHVLSFYSGSNKPAVSPRDIITSLVPPPFYPFPRRHAMIPYPDSKANLSASDADKITTRSDLITKLTYNFSIKDLIQKEQRDIPASGAPNQNSFSSVTYPSAPPMSHSFVISKPSRNFSPSILPVHKECKS